MAKCKLPIHRVKNLKTNVGDAAGAYDADADLGDMVETVGGDFNMVYITDADKNHPIIKKLTTAIVHDLYERQYYLNPVIHGHPFYEKFVEEGKVITDLVTLTDYIRERVL